MRQLLSRTLREAAMAALMLAMGLYWAVLLRALVR